LSRATGSDRHWGDYGPLDWSYEARLGLPELLVKDGCISIQLETSGDHVELPETASDFFIFIFWPSGGYIPVNLGNSKRRPMPYYCYQYTPGAASGIYYYIKSRKTGAMKLGEQQII
jgi:hypothetical protein